MKEILAKNAALLRILCGGSYASDIETGVERECSGCSARPAQCSSKIMEKPETH